MGNHTQREFDLSFAKCEYIIIVKFNYSLLLELLDPKLVYIIKTISLVAILF